MQQRCICIPAVKKNVVFVDDLIKKLDGITLIQRAIDKALSLEDVKNIYILTDSEEISLIAERNDVNVLFDSKIKLSDQNVLDSMFPFLHDVVNDYQSFIVLWPYAPLLSQNMIEKTYESFVENQWDVVISVRELKHDVMMNAVGVLSNEKDQFEQRRFQKVRACIMVRSDVFLEGKLSDVYPFVINEEPADIRSYHDWWVCEGLLRRKKIIFRVIGNNEVGMGHISRALALAHENTNDEILFVCDQQSDLAATKIVGSDYPLEVIPKEKMSERLIELDPDLVINDILNTDKEYIQSLKEANIKVVNFEDLGLGAAFSDLTINELYDEPQIEGENFRWGAEYSFLREEFIGAKRHQFEEIITDLLVTFGGTDPQNLTGATIKTIAPYCREKNITMHVVVGPGYLFLEELKKLIGSLNENKIILVNQTGVMSRVMETTSIAISSNGRTVYELAHMNIPSIVIAHHQREMTHLFSQENNGFINLGVFDASKTPEKLIQALEKLCKDVEYRKALHERLNIFNFLSNKQKIIREIYGLLHYDQDRCHYSSANELNSIAS